MEELPGKLLDAGNHLVGRLLRLHLVVDHTLDRLGPNVFRVHDGELVVVDELERLRVFVELAIDLGAMEIGAISPERACCAALGYRPKSKELIWGRIFYFIILTK